MTYAIPLIILFGVAEWLWPARPSTQSDRRLLTNYALGGILLAMGALIPLGAFTAAEWAERHRVGLLQGAELPFALFVVLMLLARSFASYWLHRASHGLAPLWWLHRLHHSDREVDLSTSLRNHPVETLIALPIAGAATLAIGPPPAVSLVAETILFAMTFWEHGNFRLNPALGSRLEWLFVTPASHCRHHSSQRAIADGNYGDGLSIWDRLFGTWQGSAPVEKIGID